MKVLGLDPGTAIVGYGLIEQKDDLTLRVVDFGCLLTSKEQEKNERLFELFRDLGKLLRKFKPDQVVLEELFFFKNFKTALAVAEARGGLILCAKNQGLPIFEYTPLEVKQALTSYGRAPKAQVQKMVKEVLNLKHEVKPDDAADALAVAWCHLQTAKLTLKK